VITRTPGAAVDIDLSGWTFTGWSPDRLPHLQVVEYELAEDAAYDDKVIGTLFKDLIRSYAGNDSLDGGSGSDTLVGGSGIDTVRGGEGDDVLVVQAGDGESGDILDGGAGHDLLLAEGDLRGAAISGIERVRVSGGKTTQFDNVFDLNTVFETSAAPGALIRVL
jgi:Ca2+-binding RTX toxin-like protein